MWAPALGILAAISLALFVYPYVIYPRLLKLFPVRPLRPAPYDGSVSLLFCAYNEAHSLPAKIVNLRRLRARYPALEILVYDDSSTDGTSDMLAAAADILTVVPGAGRTGKAAGMKKLAARATGDVLVFTDANVILAEDAIDKLLPYYGDPEVGGVCGTLVYSDNPDSPTAEVGSAYWRLDEKLRSLESATGNVMGADGSIFSVRRSLYPRFPDTVLDDFTVSMGVVFAGKRLAKAPDVTAYENSVSERDDELRRKVRIGARAYHTHAFLRPQLRRMKGIDRFKYVSRKFLRWFGGLFLGLGMAFAAAALLVVSPWLGLAAIAAGAVSLLALMCFRRGILARVSDAILAMFATLLGVFKGMRGQTVVVWSPAKSR